MEGPVREAGSEPRPLLEAVLLPGSPRKHVRLPSRASQSSRCFYNSLLPANPEQEALGRTVLTERH